MEECEDPHRKSKGKLKGKRGKGKKRLRSERGGAERRTCAVDATAAHELCSNK